MSRGRILALDPGRVRVGVAVSDETRTIAQPHSTLLRRGDRRLMVEIVGLVHSLEVTEIVVGLPLQMDGSSGPSAEEARAFGDAVSRATGLPVGFADERLTTKQAEKMMLEQGASRQVRREAGDRVAAALLLQAVMAGGPLL
ncbi:MAG TPA: Holliday junction resolvase RuvX [Candidatus Dormibacteraeota bacterium]|nr:Holliday junction resolvase RuvX [Candidatus Dormibacteraeota bacterium]